MPVLPVWISLVVYAFAAMRVVGLIVKDQITAPARKRLVDWLDPEDGPGAKGWREQLVYLVTCPWCVSIYVGAVAAVVWYTVGNNPFLVVCAVALAFSQLTGMFSDVGRG
ncbi:MAG: DUF1360 domain-containing protein [Acidimicrobiales bacterium]